MIEHMLQKLQREEKLYLAQGRCDRIYSFYSALFQELKEIKHPLPEHKELLAFIKKRHREADDELGKETKEHEDASKEEEDAEILRRIFGKEKLNEH